MTRRSPPRAGIPPSAVVAVLAALVTLAGGRPGFGAPLDERVQACHACHGPDGHSTLPDTPSIGGQPGFFVVAQLFLFREGRRESPAMIAAAKGFTNDDLRAFADYVSKLPPPPPPADAPDRALFERGRALAREQRCGVCHNQDFSGREQMPRLANQREDYLVKAMREFKSGARIGYAGAMAEELVRLSDDDLRALAHFLNHFPRN